MVGHAVVGTPGGAVTGTRSFQSLKRVRARWCPALWGAVLSAVFVVAPTMAELAPVAAGSGARTAIFLAVMSVRTNALMHGHMVVKGPVSPVVQPRHDPVPLIRPPELPLPVELPTMVGTPKPLG